ncbi:MAG: mechanosensitive ion channel family protein [bacterium]|jgi:MscS family membrane protein
MFKDLIKFVNIVALFSGLAPLSGWAGETTNTVTAVTVERVSNVWLTFGLDRVVWLQGSLLGNPLWQYLAAIIYVILALYAAKLVDYLVQVQLRKLVEKTETEIDDLMLDLAHGPVKVIAFVVLLHVGLRVFSWPEWAETFISNGLKIVVAGSLTYLLLKLVDVGMEVWQKRILASGEAVLDMHLFPVIRKSAKVFVLVVAVLVTTQNLGMNVTGLLASLSIGGLAVGLAAQDTLSNLFGAVALFTDKPFRIGDRIQFDKIDGEVEGIGLRSTRIRNLDGHLVVVPNRTMANVSLTNVSKRQQIKTVMNIGITYDTPAEGVQRAMKIIDEVYRPHPKTADLIVSFDKFENSSLNILVVHWWNSADYKEYLQNFQLLNLELKRRFDAAGISFAFPSQTLYLKSDGIAVTPAANRV